MKKRGYRILKSNYRTPFGEADIVAASPDGFTCFVEVKARLTDSFGSGAEAVTPQKQQRYRMIAKYWVAKEGKEVPVRFDVASVGEKGIDYLENAFF